MTGARIEIINMHFHLSTAEVASGLIMDRGASIGMAGKTGRATCPHLRRPFP
jgi:murein DD-endopeptidase MepM/ murein hydrolase activator NlpD